MSKWAMRFVPALAIVIAISLAVRNHVGASEKAMVLPTPAVDEVLASSPGQQTAVVAGGCFWGIQAVFQHVKGVISATSGYSGGSASTAEYETVSTGTTNHAESVQIVYDPSRVTYGQLLQVFFSVAHDPTQLNRQGPDEGTQYRSVIFYGNAEQKRIADAYIQQLEQAKTFPHRIVTQVVPLKAFYPAEGYHQNYAARHPDNPYIAHYDLPKVANLQQMFPQLYRNQ
ncbi:MAG TPA: peptide-methionine (S)-S-oxide reductase MsrA [Candidatus Binatia bacterium]|nr:peptide-methionine (S)-S-oxide reductase MsrA [Candidatus Binatia bacterium]